MANLKQWQRLIDWVHRSGEYPVPVQRHMGRGWIQWKGTDVCCDVHCYCGALLHVDGEFAYVVECPHCKRQLWLDGHIEVVELPADLRQDDAIVGMRDDRKDREAEITPS